jgi:hypothetical protein
MATKTFLLVSDDHNLLCTRYFFGNPLLITVESDCRYYMTVHDSGAIRVHATKPYDFGNLEALKVRCPKCSSQMVPIHSSFNNDETQAFQCIICKK